MELPSSNSFYSFLHKVLFWIRTSPTKVAKKKEEIELVDNLEEYFHTTCREVMVPRTKMVTVEKGTPLSQAADLFVKTGHSRIPVQNRKRDNIVGILYAKDLFKYFNSSESIAVSQIMRKVHFTSFSQPIHHLLAKFKKERVHLAIVIDEHGGVDGLITIEDVLEILVGDISDEFDQSRDPSYERINDGTILIDADFPLDEFNELYGTDFHKEGTETIGGFVCHRLARIPEKSEEFKIGDLNFSIEERSERSLLKLRLVAPRAGSQGANGLQPPE